ncbi:MAG: alpha/beta hydrolase [Planctomycetes bacterium]|nr:alpha/beta hydrolase [Planctomycetota bacterium]
MDLHVKHYGGRDVGWSETSLDDFFASGDSAQPTMIYVHGNQISWNEAIQRAWNLRNSVLGCSHLEPIRLVIWSWPSEKVHGFVRDARVKAARTNGEAHYFAWFLSQLDPATPLSIVGYSFGARVATGALHLLGGGELGGQTLPLVKSAPTRSVRVALIAAALHRHWLRPGGCHEYALSLMDRLLIQYNSCDPVLQRYRFIEKRGRPSALGYSGVYIDEPLNTRIEQRDVCRIVGKSHAEFRYTRSATLMREIRDAIFEEVEFSRE